MTRFPGKNSYLLTLAIVCLTGCGEYLSENPDNRVELNTTEKAAQLLTNAYAGTAYTFTEWMGDNVTYTTGTTIQPKHLQCYTWDEVTAIEQDTPSGFWTSTYEAIAHANEVLAVVDDLPGERAQRDAVKGEALLARAYGHFMLVNLFAKHYDPETADNDLGIPYVDEPETQFIKKYTRQSVDDVYDRIEDDIEEGLDLVDDSFYANSGKYHFTHNAALALASRFYLFKGDLTNCIKYSSEMLGADPSVFIKDINGLLGQSVNGEDFIRMYTAPTDQSNLLLIRQVTTFPVTVGYWPTINQLRYIISSNPWGSDDVRIDVRYPIYVRGSGVTLGKYEFLFERSSLTSNVGFYYTIAPAFRGEEVLLNRAECYVRDNQLNLALADLQIYTNKRYEDQPTLTLAQLRSYYGTTNNQAATLNFIVDERQKEFMHEGLRWFDIKRFGIEVPHLQGNGTTITLESDDLRKVIQLPQAAIDIGSLEPNPR